MLVKDRFFLVAIGLFFCSFSHSQPKKSELAFALNSTNSDYATSFMTKNENHVKNGKLSQTINFDMLVEKRYGDEVFELKATSSSGLPVAFKSSNESVVAISGHKATIKSAGTVEITASQLGDYNYNLATEVVQVLTINKAVLTVKVDDQRKKYGQPNPFLTYTYSGFVYEDDICTINAEPVGMADVDRKSTVGEYIIRLEGGEDDNYVFDYITGKLIVEKAPLIVVPAKVSKRYGEANPELTIKYEGFVNGEGNEVLSEEPIAEAQVGRMSKVGEYAIEISGGKANNYNLKHKKGVLTVEKAVLRVIAENKIIRTGEAPPTYTLSYTGFVNGEDESVLDVQPGLNALAPDSTVAGTYKIRLCQGYDNNYELKLIEGVLIVDDMMGLLNDNRISVYPNGVFDMLKADQSEVFRIDIYDLNGRMIMAFNSAEEIDVSNLRKGKYVLKQFNSEGVILSANRIDKK